MACVQLSMCLLIYIDFSFGNFDNLTYERNITELLLNLIGSPPISMFVTWE